MAVEEKDRKRKAPKRSKDSASVKKTKVDNDETQHSKGSRSSPKKASAKSSHKSSKQTDIVPLEQSDDAASDVDDQTAALLKGFESSSDSDADDKLEVKAPRLSTRAVAAQPQPAELQKRLAGITTSANDTPGVIYVGRIPHGFYEHQMQAYFSQFGAISRLRLSRNRRTGASKHYAFIEFASAEVARIVADTMDNYLMFGHILKVKFVPPEKLHAELFKGAGRRFKKVPWTRIEGRKLEAGADREGWEKRVRGEEKRRADKAEKLKKLGYDYQMPALRDVDDVPVKQLQDAEPLPQITAAGDATDDQPVPAVVSKAKPGPGTKRTRKGQEADKVDVHVDAKARKRSRKSATDFM